MHVFPDPSERRCSTCETVQLSTYWQHYRLTWSSGCDFPVGATPGIGNKWCHIIVCRLQTYILNSLPPFPSHYCCCLWMGYASDSLTVSLDMEMTQMPGNRRLEAAAEGSQMWKRVICKGLQRTHLNLLWTKNVNTWARFSLWNQLEGN